MILIRNGTTQAMEECFNQIHYMIGQAMGGMPNIKLEGERLVLVLERQSPLSNASPSRLVAHMEDKEQEWALVPVIP